MKPDKEILAIFALLKAHLKSKRISYNLLSIRLKMSESNLKRIFSAKSCSLELLNRICKASEISLLDLVTSASKNDVLYFQLPDSAINSFMQNLDLFIFYRKLGNAGDLNKHIHELKLTNTKIDSQLHLLENLKLVKKIKNKYELTNTGYLDLSNAPKLVEKINLNWVPWFFDKVVTNQNNENYFLKASSTGLSKVNLAKLFGEIDQLLEKYREVGNTDQKIGASNYSSVGICIGIGPHRVGLFEEDIQNLPKTKKSLALV